MAWHHASHWHSHVEVYHWATWCKYMHPSPHCTKLQWMVLKASSKEVVIVFGTSEWMVVLSWIIWSMRTLQNVSSAPKHWLWMAVLIEELVHGKCVLCTWCSWPIKLLVMSCPPIRTCDIIINYTYCMIILSWWRTSVVASILRILHSPPRSMYAVHLLNVEPCTRPSPELLTMLVPFNRYVWFKGSVLY